MGKGYKIKYRLDVGTVLTFITQTCRMMMMSDTW